MKAIAWELFVNTFTTDDKYSLLNRENLTQPIHMQLSQKQTFSGISFASLKAILTFAHFQIKINLIADAFPKLRAQKNVVM